MSEMGIKKWLYQSSKYIAFFCTAAYALAYWLQIRWLSCVFTVVACIAFSIWLWRAAWRQVKLSDAHIHLATDDHSPDDYSIYDAGLRQLLDQLEQGFSRYREVLVYQQRLSENISQSKRYGDNETRRTERSEIIDRLNEIALSTLNISFNELCEQARTTSKQERTGSPQYAYVQVYSTGKRALILGALVLIDLVGTSWLAYNLAGELVPAISACETGYLAGRELADNLAGELIPAILDRCPARMVFVEEGDFWRGAAPGDRDAQEDEKPWEKVYLEAFCIDKTEVSNEQYAEFVNDTDFSPPLAAASLPSEDKNFWTGDTYLSQVSAHPVVRISGKDAQAYCQWLSTTIPGKSCSLPSEDQWEKAARGTEGLIYPWGNEWDSKLANGGTMSQIAEPVGNYPGGASPCGALNMAGNVAEWVNDRKWVNLNDGKIHPYIICGGSFHDSPPRLRTSARSNGFAEGYNEEYPLSLASKNHIGFRCVCQDR